MFSFSESLIRNFTIFPKLRLLKLTLLRFLSLFRKVLRSFFEWINESECIISTWINKISFEVRSSMIRPFLLFLSYIFYFLWHHYNSLRKTEISELFVFASLGKVCFLKFKNFSETTGFLNSWKFCRKKILFLGQ